MKWNIFIIILSVFICITLFFSIFNYFEKSNKDIACKDCNVILISIDTLRADHLGIYDYEKNTSPHLDQFAKENILFKNFYSQATYTISSHASIFTSLYPFNHHVYDQNARVFNSTLTLPQILKLYNYTTVAFIGSGSKAALPPYIFAYMFDSYNVKGVTTVDNTFPETKKWLELNSNGKFFLFWHIYDVHCPYRTPKLIDPFCDSLLTSYSNVVIKDSIDRYDNSISYVDSVIADFLNYLKEQGLYEKTIIIITSDHGEAFGEHKEYQHAGLPYFEQVNVPLILHIPGFNPTVVFNQGQSIDIVPTILNALNISIPARIDGASLLPSIRNSSIAVHNFTYSEYAGSYAFKSKDWEIFSDGNKVQLFNLNEDRYEKQDVMENNKKIGDFMKTEFDKWLSQHMIENIGNKSIVLNSTMIGYP